MTFHYRYRKQILIGVILLLFIGITTFFIIKNNNHTVKKTTKKKIIVEKKKEIKKEEINYIEVDIKGEVISPGIYKLKEGSRVIDQTTPNMIQRISEIFERNALISKRI